MSIEVMGLRRSFGTVKAVDGIDLTAAPGEVTALVGPNGAGKTTLLLVLATLLAPDEGTVRVAGHDPVTAPRQVRRLMGWMPDGFGTWDTLTVREVLATVAATYGIGRAAAADRIEELLALVHLADLHDRPARVLSRGQKQRLGLARALVHDPDVLLLDEPASGLDPRSRIELRDVLRDLADRGRTVLVSSHILVELEEMADRAVIIDGGRTVATHDLRSPGRTGRWLLAVLDAAAFEAALPRVADDDGRAQGPRLQPSTVRRVPVPAWPPTYELPLGDPSAAADLVARLVTAGVPVCGLAPATDGGLEAAYLSATAEHEGARR
ncbi:MAG: ABC transporter ATP-binding protein [Austwickia sp.]|nr:ABC transporter ATP-binding protein [Austwickia sp.]